ncbi:histidine kinase [Skermanella stibiiresistens SB22]|uniref:histidine kinase n=1 Tax=Skermanella stibiiresistens SB22 TaxID=1385369 RepID=W9H6M0_9PROT|nr:PAS domain S-box protein [Skermanella stibiiresistens]EWY41664.1 histidine kinase [Skermanella stibiiresistens SB22]
MSVVESALRRWHRVSAAIGARLANGKPTRRALEESEARFRAIVDDQTEFISRCSPGYLFTFVNRAYAQQLGRGRGEIIGSSVLDLMTAEQRIRFVDQLSKLTPSCPTVSYEMSSTTPDGRPIWEEWTDRALYDGTGRLIGYQSVGRDITATKAVEATLTESAEELALIADCMPVAMAITRADRWEVLFSNIAARETFGLYPGCPEGQLLSTYVDPADRARLVERVDREGGVQGFELSLRRIDGVIVRALISARPIQFRGSPALVAAVTDITDRQEIEQALRTSEARLNAFMRHAPAGMYLKDLEGRYVMANPEMEKVQNRPVSEIIGRTPEDVFPVTLAARIRRHDGEVLATGATVFSEEHVPDLPSYVWRMVVRFPIRDETGRFTHIGGFIFDMSDQKRVEAEASRQRAVTYQREKLAALGSLLAGVAHELNNPLSVVLGRAIMLEESCGDPETRDSLRRLRTAAERCARIVRSFLSLARQKAPEVKPVDVRRVLDGSVEMLANGLRSAGIEVTREDAPDPPRVMADEDELHQVFMNLIVNAQQAIEMAPPRSDVAARRVWLTTSAPGDGFVRIEVADNGPGVPEALRDLIFNPFFTTKPIGAGTGLGLSYCHGIVSSHGGSIGVGARSGGGALFTVTLPACAAKADIEAPAARAFDPFGGSGAVLIVDDEPEVVTMLTEVLAGDGHEVSTAEDGVAALEILREGSFDAILCDIRMPRLDGVGLLRELEACRPELVPRVLMMTGDVLRAAAALPVDRAAQLLEKPVDPAEVRRRVAELIRQTR